MDDETGALVTVTLTGADWARLRECLETLAGCAEGCTEHFAGLLQQPTGDEQCRGDRTAWQRDLGRYLALVHDARRLSQAVGRRVAAQAGGA